MRCLCINIFFLMGIVKATPTIVYVKMGGYTTLKCVASADGTVTWRHKHLVYSIGREVNKALFHDEKISIVGTDEDNEFNLRITNISQADEGVYWCVSGTGKNIVDVRFDIRIMEAPSELAILNHTRNIAYAKEGETVHLQCKVKMGIPPGLLQWYSNGVVLVNGTGEVSYRFISTVTDDLKIYICRAKHPALDVDMEESVQIMLSRAPITNLTVEPSPPFYEAQNIVLNCNVNNLLGVVSIAWKKDTQTLHYRSLLVYLTNLSSSDSGMYTCTVENEFGRTSSSIVLIVKGNVLLEGTTTEYQDESVTSTDITIPNHNVYFVMPAAFVVLFLTCSIVTCCIKCRQQVLTNNTSPSSNQVNITNDRVSSSTEANYEEIVEDEMIPQHEQEKVTQQSVSIAETMQCLENEIGSSSSKSENSSIEPSEGTDGYLNPYVSILEENKVHYYKKCPSQKDLDETFEKD